MGNKNGSISKQFFNKGKIDSNQNSSDNNGLRMSFSYQTFTIKTFLLYNCWVN